VNREKILVVDDSKPMLKLLEVVLKERYTVYPASSAFNAINWLQKGNTPDLIITDIEIPYIDGIDFIHHVSNSIYYNNIPILILSGYSKEEIKLKKRNLKIQGYIMKPFDPTELQKRIDGILAKSNATGSANLN